MRGADENGRAPVIRRRPEIIYGLRNIIENAVGFARSKVLVTADWNATALTVEVFDDGPGFAPEILARLGEPYLGARGRERARRGGLGLGFFIAKTLLERTGAALAFDNRAIDGAKDSAAGATPGAWVAARWPRRVLEPDG
jgi:two-component system sensor histidine kinase RegB